MLTVRREVVVLILKSIRCGRHIHGGDEGWYQRLSREESRGELFGGDVVTYLNVSQRIGGAPQRWMSTMISKDVE